MRNGSEEHLFASQTFTRHPIPLNLNNSEPLSCVLATIQFPQLGLFNIEIIQKDFFEGQTVFCSTKKLLGQSNAESSLVKQMLPLAAPFGFLVLLSSDSGITIKI